MLIRTDPATWADVYDVAMRMRESDRLEFAALAPVDAREDLALALAERFWSTPDCLCVRDAKGERVAIGSVVQIRPNVGSLLFYATDRFADVYAPITKAARRQIEAAKASGVHRIEAAASAAHTSAHRWMRALGLRPEAILRGFGKNGETFVQFSWVSDDCTTGNDV